MGCALQSTVGRACPCVTQERQYGQHPVVHLGSQHGWRPVVHLGPLAWSRYEKCFPGGVFAKIVSQKGQNKKIHSFFSCPTSSLFFFLPLWLQVHFSRAKHMNNPFSVRFPGVDNCETDHNCMFDPSF
jgi:hypothetical protein